MSSKQRVFETLRHVAALVVLGIGLLGYVLAGGTAAYFALVVLSDALAGR